MIAKLHSKSINIARRSKQILLSCILIACRPEKMRLSICITCRPGNIAKLHSKIINIARRSGNIAIEHLYCLPSRKYCYWAFLLLGVWSIMLLSILFAFENSTASQPAVVGVWASQPDHQPQFGFWRNVWSTWIKPSTPNVRVWLLQNNTREQAWESDHDNCPKVEWCEWRSDQARFNKTKVKWKESKRGSKENMMKARKWNKRWCCNVATGFWKRCGHLEVADTVDI